MSDFTPRKLGDKYVLLDLLGTGGMAEVYRGILVGDKGFEKLIVIKQLLEHFAKEKEHVSQFTSEARLAALLQHENIATTFDFGEVDGRYFMAMEYLFGKDLHTVIQTAKATKALTPQIAVMICMKICEAMGYAHALTDLQGVPLKIIHRDLTPHNIFLTYDGKIKIIDFGIAKTELHDNKTRVGVVKGKITYMSPEQLGGEALDLRSDIFSIGILLYEMLSGRRMYTGDTATLIRKAITVEYERLETVVAGLNPNIYHVLDRTLTVEPNDRYQSCEEMQADLETCLTDGVVGHDPRALKSFILSLFSRHYQEEKERGLEALRSARKLGKEPAPALEKTAFITPELGEDGSTHEIARTIKPQSTRFSPWAILAALGAMGLLGVSYLAFISGDPTGEQPLPKRDTAEHSGVAGHNTDEAPPSVIMNKTTPQQSEVLDELNRKAEAAIMQGNLSEPEGDNARYYYREIEAIAPDDLRISEGRRRIAERYAERAEYEISKGRFSEAMMLVSKAAELSPELPRLASIQERLEAEKSRVIDDLSRRAEERIRENKLTTPADDCALKYYRDIEAIDSDNEVVEMGLRKIGNRYALLADGAFQRMDFDRARHFVNEGISVDPNNIRLQILERQLMKSKPELIMKGVEKKLKSLF